MKQQIATEIVKKTTAIVKHYGFERRSVFSTELGPLGRLEGKGGALSFFLSLESWRLPGITARPYDGVTPKGSPVLKPVSENSRRLWLS